MADRGGFAEEATLDTATSAPEAQPDNGTGTDTAVTYDELTALIERVATDKIRPLLDANYRGMESQVGRIRNDVAGAVQALAELKEEVGETREVRALMRAMSKGTVTPEEVEAEATQLRQEAEARQEKRELESLRRQAAERASATKTTTTDADPDPDADAQASAANAKATWQATFNDTVVPRLQRYAEKQGVELLAVQDALPGRVPVLPNGQPDIVTYLDQAETAIEQAAARVRRATRPRPPIDTTIPSGTTASADQDLVNKLGWGESLSGEDFARATKLFDSGNGLLPQRRPQR